MNLAAIWEEGVWDLFEDWHWVFVAPIVVSMLFCNFVYQRTDEDKRLAREKRRAAAKKRAVD